MYDNKRGKWLVLGDKENETDRHYRLMDLEELTNTVMMALQQVYMELGEGLPDCVYQLKLHNELLKKGFQLQEEALALDHYAENEPVRSQAIINEVLVIEYTTGGCSTDHCRKRMTFDLEGKNYADGLLMAGENKKISITDVKQSNTYH